MQTIVLGGGCFWCTEAVFRSLKGVISVTAGYAGGDRSNPTYHQVCSGNTGHAEVIEIRYDDAQVHLEDLLTIFFATHDPTTPNRQGADVGTQYRSLIYFTDTSQKSVIDRFITDLDKSSEFGSPIITEVAPLDKFWPAESEHQNYYENNPSAMYCSIVIHPKLAKVQQKYAELLSTENHQNP